MSDIDLSWVPSASLTATEWEEVQDSLQRLLDGAPHRDVWLAELERLHQQVRRFARPSAEPPPGDVLILFNRLVDPRGRL